MIFWLKSNIVTFCSHSNTVNGINAVFTNFYFETLMLCCKHTHWNSSDSTKLTLCKQKTLREEEPVSTFRKCSLTVVGIL